MGMTNQEKQAAYRERMAAKGIVPLSVEVPRKVAERISTEARKLGTTRSKVVIEKLTAKPKKQDVVTSPLPKDITKEANRIVKLIGKGLRACDDPAAMQALNDALDAIYGLAGMVAACQTPTKKKRKRRGSS